MDSRNEHHRQEYQGFHGYYLNPTVQDVPTISAELAAKWNNLPRRQGAGVKGASEPMAGGSQGHSSQPHRPGRLPVTPKLDPDENPVVYIELPENSGSDVADRREVEDDQTFVEDTIFYNPFKDQRIATPSSSSVSSGTSSPPPPSTLNIRAPDRVFPGSSNSGLPSIMNKQTDVYGQFGLPSEYERGDFPEPPPAYTETDTSNSVAPSQINTPVSSQPMTAQSPIEPPRTQVLVSPDLLESQNTILCHSCGFLAHCIRIREAGMVTHVIAGVVLLFAAPLVVLIYCTNWFKYVNYYCGHCNKFAAYELPIACQGLKYVKVSDERVEPVRSAT